MQKCENIDPEFARKVKKHFYVEDLNSGAKKDLEFYKKVKSRFSEGSFSIRKWHANDPE